MANPSLRCITTVDILQKRPHPTIAAAGIKRGFDQIKPDLDDRIARDIEENANPRICPKRQRQSNLPPNRLEASVIRKLTNDADIQREPVSVRQLTPSVPGPSQNPLLSLSHPRYGLPDLLVANFAGLGIHSIYPWQSSCLLGRGLLDGKKNLVYTAPTGGGKSLVADVLMLKRVIEDPSRKAILVLPYVALVQEKLKWLRKVVDGVRKNVSNLAEPPSPNSKWRRRYDSSVRVVGFFGGSKARAGWTDFDVAICTIEKVHFG